MPKHLDYNFELKPVVEEKLCSARILEVTAGVFSLIWTTKVISISYPFFCAVPHMKAKESEAEPVSSTKFKF